MQLDNTVHSNLTAPVERTGTVTIMGARDTKKVMTKRKN